MGEHDYPTVVSLTGALKETIGAKAPTGLTRPLTDSSLAEIRAHLDER